MTETNIWKLRDAKARFSELVRRARAGAPQHVTVHGKEAVIVVDAERYEVRPKSRRPRTMAGFIEASKKYRGVTEGVDFEPPLGMAFTPHAFSFDEDEKRPVSRKRSD
jgi:prevent-host-death family protein